MKVFIHLKSFFFEEIIFVYRTSLLNDSSSISESSISIKTGNKSKNNKKLTDKSDYLKIAGTTK